MKLYFSLIFSFCCCYMESAKAQEPKTVYDKATQFYQVGKIDSALRLMLDFETIISKDSGTNGLAYAGYLDQLATLYSVIGDLQHGLPIATKALNMYREIESDSSVNFANAMLNVINLNLRRMNLVRAEKQIDTALKIYVKNLGDTSPEWMNLMNSKGIYYQQTGQMDKALLIILELLDKSRRYYPEKYEEMAFYLVNISNLFLDLGHYQKAKHYIEELERIFKKHLGTNHSLYVNLLLCRGKLELFTFQKNKAHATFLEAKSSIGQYEANSDVAQAADNNLAYTSIELLKLDTALILFEKVIGKWKELNMGKSVFVGRTLFNMCLVYFLKNDYQNAYKVINEAIEVFRGLNKELDLDYSSCFFLKSAIQFYQKDFKNAFQTYSIGLDLNFRYWKYASSSLAFNDQFSFMNYLGVSFDFLTQQMELNQSLRKDTAALQLLFKQQILLSNSVSSVKPSVKYADEELNALLKESEKLKRNYASLYVSNPMAKRQLNQLQSQIDLYDVKINSRYSDNKFQTNADAFGYKDILDRLAEHEVLVKVIKYTFFDLNKKVNAYCALIFKKSSNTPIFELLGTESEINKALQRKAGDGRIYYNGYLDPGKSLGNPKQTQFRKYIDTYWRNITRHIKPGNSVYIIPDGLFQKLSFAAMPYRGSSLMIDETNTRVFYDFPSFLARNQNSIQNDLSVGIWGGMDYNSRDTIKGRSNYLDLHAPVVERNNIGTPLFWTNLKNSSVEVLDLAGMLKSENVNFKTFTGSLATEESFKSQLGKWSVLHLSTHGYSFGSQVSKQNEYLKVPDINYTESWLKSGIVFSGANNFWGKDSMAVNKDNGVLTSLETVALNLSSTELVVISACETALGEEVTNNYLIGMPSALRMAGAKRLLLSLWNVPDKETKELIRHFYKYLLQTKNPEASLRAAQKVMKARYTPYYWAGFVLIE